MVQAVRNSQTDACCGIKTSSFSEFTVGTEREMAERIGKAQDVQKMSGRYTKNAHLPVDLRLFLYLQ